MAQQMQYCVGLLHLQNLAACLPLQVRKPAEDAMSLQKHDKYFILTTWSQLCKILLATDCQRVQPEMLHNKCS